VTGLDFNSAKLELGVTVSGPSGTQGHTAVTIADSLVANFTGFTVSLDGKQIDYTVTDSGDYWVLSFNYSHSTHQVTVGLNAEVKQSQISIDTTILLAVSATIIALAIAGVFAFRRAHKKP
jgi:hypothetical protein